MALDDTTVAALLAALESHAEALGRFDRVNMHETKNAPGKGVVCSIWLQRLAPASGAQSGLASTSAVLVWQARLTLDMLYEAQDAIDPILMGAATMLIGAFAGDLDLNVTGVRSVDLRGMAGTPLSCDAGYLPQDAKVYRAYTVTIPIIINDAWDEAA